MYEGIDEPDLDRVVLDLPEPWRVVKHAVEALRPGGILVAYLPTILQVGRLREELADAPFGMVETLEVLQRRLARRGPVDPARPPHGRPHRVPHPRAVARARFLSRAKRERARCRRSSWRSLARRRRRLAPRFHRARVRVGRRRARARHRRALRPARRHGVRRHQRRRPGDRRGAVPRARRDARAGARARRRRARAPLRRRRQAAAPLGSRSPAPRSASIGVLALRLDDDPVARDGEGLAGPHGARLERRRRSSTRSRPNQPAQFAAWGRAISDAPYPSALGPLDDPPDPGRPPEAVIPADGRRHRARRRS